jgi:glyoxylate/hydroxypyruvate reductase A
VFSLGAGVDHLLPLKDRVGIHISRVRHPDLTMRMVEYVVFSALYLHRKIRACEESHALAKWTPLTQAAASGVRVGVMGVGVRGKACGEALQNLGFKVAGWTNPTVRLSGFRGPERSARIPGPH